MTTDRQYLCTERREHDLRSGGGGGSVEHGCAGNGHLYVGRLLLCLNECLRQLLDDLLGLQLLLQLLGERLEILL